MTDLMFGVIIIALIVAFAIYVEETNKEKAKLVNALIAKTPEQARDLGLADNLKPISVPTSTPQDIVPLDSLNDEEFETHIQNSLKEE